MGTYFWQGLGLGFAAAAQPGPLLMFLLAQTTLFGWRRAVVAAFAPLLSDGPIVALMLFLLTRLPLEMVRVLQVVGGGYLLFLGWNVFRELRHVALDTAVSAPSARQSILKAALVNLLSPNPYLFWGTVAGPILLNGWQQSPLTGTSFVFAFYAGLIGVFVFFVVTFALVGQVSGRLLQRMGQVSAVLLFGFGLVQIWQGLMLR
ncbi:MAG: hypothetical protein D6706_03250 [Chloroflexi bacterium]|nr:MAG: hypothetical protein D6706_03250 [Chloroflexota bacterium]